jgi:hypothetical protein
LIPGENKTVTIEHKNAAGFRDHPNPQSRPGTFAATTRFSIELDQLKNPKFNVAVLINPERTIDANYNS